jgi:preprotein translocase subunit SecG
MYTVAVIIHVIVCFLMIASILLQAGKGAEIGAAFGGSSQTVFGSRGPGTFLSKVTIGAAVIFMLTSLGLALLSKERTFSSTVIDLNKKETPAPTAPILPHGNPTAEPTQPESKSSGQQTPAPAPAAP